jgi:hypothetical protein
MSKLAFKEKYYEESSSSSEDEHVPDSRRQGNYKNNSGRNNGPNNGPNKDAKDGKIKKIDLATVRNTSSNSGQEMDEVDSLSEGEINEGDNETFVDGTTVTNTTSSTVFPDANSNANVSTWLSKFLGTKRVGGLVAPPPDIAPTNDEFLKEFHDTFELGQTLLEVVPVTPEDNDVIDEVVVFFPKDLDAADNNEANEVSTEALVLEAEAAAANSLPTAASVRLFNLPYNATEVQARPILCVLFCDCYCWRLPLFRLKNSVYGTV